MLSYNIMVITNALSLSLRRKARDHNAELSRPRLQLFFHRDTADFSRHRNNRLDHNAKLSTHCRQHFGT